jgi:hypothetical protein
VAISYGSAGNSASSPFVDYANDVAYVGADDGKLYKFTGVFNGTPALAWTSSALVSGPLNSPVYWPGGNRIFVTNRDTNNTVDCYLWSVDASNPGSRLSLLIGHMVQDGPIVDPVTSQVFAFGFSSPSLYITQKPANFGAGISAVVASPPSATSFYQGAFDDSYFGAGAEYGHLYVCGTKSNSRPTLYRIGFASGGVMNSSIDPYSLEVGTGAAECSPLSELPYGGVDRLFLGVTNNCSGSITGGCVESFDITSYYSSYFPAAPAVSPVAESGGTGGIIIDNMSSQPQAASIYFGTLTGNTIVKLTQSTLQ